MYSRVYVCNSVYILSFMASCGPVSCADACYSFPIGNWVLQVDAFFTATLTPVLAQALVKNVDCCHIECLAQLNPSFVVLNFKY